MLSKPTQSIDIDNKSSDIPSNSQADNAGNEKKSTATLTGSVGTSKRRNKGSDQLVLDLNDRSKYTKEVSV